MSLLAALLMATATVANTFIGARITTGSPGNNLQLALPAGAAVNDLAVYTYACDPSSGSLTSDGGAGGTLKAFGAIQSDSMGGAWWKRLSSTDIANGYVQVSASSSTSAAGAIALWRGGSLAATLIGATEAATGTTANLSDPTGTADYFAFAWLDDDITTVSTWPTTYTQARLENTVGSSGNGGTLACAVALAGDPGAESFVFGSSDTWFALVVRIA